MQAITTLVKLEARIAECNDVLTHEGDDAMRRLFGGFRLDLSAQMPADPFSAQNREF